MAKRPGDLTGDREEGTPDPKKSRTENDNSSSTPVGPSAPPMHFDSDDLLGLFNVDGDLLNGLNGPAAPAFVNAPAFINNDEPSAQYNYEYHAYDPNDDDIFNTFNTFDVSNDISFDPSDINHNNQQAIEPLQQAIEPAHEAIINPGQHTNNNQERPTVQKNKPLTEEQKQRYLATGRKKREAQRAALRAQKNLQTQMPPPPADSTVNNPSLMTVHQGNRPVFTDFDFNEEEDVNPAAINNNNNRADAIPVYQAPPLGPVLIPPPPGGPVMVATLPPELIAYYQRQAQKAAEDARNVQLSVSQEEQHQAKEVVKPQKAPGTQEKIAELEAVQNILKEQPQVQNMSEEEIKAELQALQPQITNIAKQGVRPQHTTLQYRGQKNPRMQEDREITRELMKERERLVNRLKELQQRLSFLTQQKGSANGTRVVSHLYLPGDPSFSRERYTTKSNPKNNNNNNNTPPKNGS